MIHFKIIYIQISVSVPLRLYMSKVYYTKYFKTMLFKFVHVKIVTLGNTADCTETFEIPGTSTGLEGRGSGLETRPIVTGWVVCWLKLRRDSKCKQSWLENVYFWNLKFTNFNILRKPRCLPNFTKRCKKMQQVDTYKYRRLKFTLTSCIYIFEITKQSLWRQILKCTIKSV